MKPESKSSLTLVLAIVLFCQLHILSCSWSADHQNRLLITNRGIADLIEINMTLDEFISNGIAFKRMASPYGRPERAVYDVTELGVQFETNKNRIARIWFFADKNEALQIRLPNEHSMRNLSSITGNDVVNNYGPVNRYVDKNPPKGQKEAMWVKYRPFGIDSNTIFYPGNPFHFGLNWDDTLSYITVSNVEVHTD